MRVGYHEDDPCGRLVGDWGNRRTCTGTIATLGRGRDATGQPYRMLGCTHGCWSIRDNNPPPPTAGRRL